MCDMCTPGPQCGLDAYVLNGKIIKIEGTKDFPSNGGKLCPKGASNRQYVYREDRIRTPLRRVGPRGSGEFEPIGWEEAMDNLHHKRTLLPKKICSGLQNTFWCVPVGLFALQIFHFYETLQVRHYLMSSSLLPSLIC